MGPIQAAEIALGETLVLHAGGRKPPAVVWSLGDDYAPISTALYLPAEAHVRSTL